MGALGAGALLAGLLAQVAPSPLQLPFWIDLALLAPAAALVSAMPEPVTTRGAFRLSAQLPHVPAEVRAVFVPAALAGFAGFAVLGLFTAVAPGFLGQILGIASPATAGAVVFAVFAASTLGQTLLERAFGAGALVAGSAVLVVGMVLLGLGLALSSLELVVISGVVAGLGQGASFRHGLAAINAVSPPRQRGEVASAFFVLMYVGISVPVVGVGLAAQAAGLRTAGLVFAAAVAVLAAAVLRSERRRHAADTSR
jgi:hypothetical protein